jgi:hypothetical protein
MMVMICCMPFCFWCRFALAHVNTEVLAAKAMAMNDMRQQLGTLLHLSMAGKADSATKQTRCLLDTSWLWPSCCHSTGRCQSWDTWVHYQSICALCVHKCVSKSITGLQYSCAWLYFV